MRIVRAILLLGGLLWPAFLHSAIPLSEYHQRREKLRKDLNGSVVLFGQREDRELIGRFRQESNFYYLTGWTEPGARLLITHDDEILFLPHHDERVERYTGRRTSAEDSDSKEKTGFQNVLPVEKFESQLLKALDSGPEVYALLHSRDEDALKSLLAFRELRDGEGKIGPLRRIKSKAEIAELQRAADVSMAAHRAAWNRLTPGAHEYDAQAAFTEVMLDRGCEDYAYPPIIGSGPNGTVLHYEANRRRMDRGEVVVIDAAAECDYYASDITRTIPVGGKYSAREREIYEIVLGAQKAAIAAIKPGAMYYGETGTISQIAKDYINSHGKDQHGEPLGKYFTHGLGHFVGIDVHDAGGVPLKLEEGMVLTVEPGIYIPEENIGVRIEDVVLVTHDGARVMTAALPKEPTEVEKALQ
ncbi:MAG: aminopeptidase P family protein [Acidobacteriaceae bacterium]|nr:aminopeptidase P family protein [Acidobacteriaceae bacterium]MBV9778373.1 aminopeptidase P family protein [Acidobacteriaceae bacterium]